MFRVSMGIGDGIPLQLARFLLHKKEGPVSSTRKKEFIEDGIKIKLTAVGLA